ncbi:transmembrane protein 192 [Megalops cyprinoides]|uniref:transmembrane protein 192 n=1 Tax=Megalops cyprinoides TaxID=118141 RepID=UPI001865264A|nr:transmembrane protein 192 [Megalops cyprinoides]
MDSKEPPTHINNSSMEITQSLEEDPLVDGPLISPEALDSAIKKEFQKLPTSWAAFLLSFLQVAFVCLSIVLAVFCSILPSNQTQCSHYLQDLKSGPVIVFAKVALWLLLVVFERFVHRHHSGARNRGYLQFYRSMRNLKSLPVFIHSAGNAAVLIILSAESLLKGVRHLGIGLLLGVLVLELLLAVPCLLIYSVKVRNFNKQRPEPDISQEERSHAYSSHAHVINTETGFRDSSNLEEVVEKQADLIEYLKQHNTLLSKRILSLTSQQIRD